MPSGTIDNLFATATEKKQQLQELEATLRVLGTDESFIAGDEECKALQAEQDKLRKELKVLRSQLASQEKVLILEIESVEERVATCRQLKAHYLRLLESSIEEGDKPSEKQHRQAAMQEDTEMTSQESALNDLNAQLHHATKLQLELDMIESEHQAAQAKMAEALEPSSPQENKSENCANKIRRQLEQAILEASKLYRAKEKLSQRKQQANDSYRQVMSLMKTVSANLYP